MDIVTYALLNKKIGQITPGYDFKGTVASTDDLPESPTTGDLYLVTAEGNAQFVYDGSDWQQIYSQIASNNDIDGLY